MNSAMVQAVLISGEAHRLQQSMSYVIGTPKIEYVGLSMPGVAEGAIGWQIRKMVYDGDNIVKALFASDSANFDFEWDERASYFA